MSQRNHANSFRGIQGIIMVVKEADSPESMALLL